MSGGCSISHKRCKYNLSNLRQKGCKKSLSLLSFNLFSDKDDLLPQNVTSGVRVARRSRKPDVRQIPLWRP